MEIKAKAKFIRIAPRKVRLVADMIRGKKVSAALDILLFCKRWAKQPILKLLNSAVANAEHNFNLKKENLYIKSIIVNGGPVLKRWAPKAHGSANVIRKRMSHIEIILNEIKIKNSTTEPVSKKISEGGKPIVQPVDRRTVAKKPRRDTVKK